MKPSDFTSNWRSFLPSLEGWPLLPVGAGPDFKAPIDISTGKPLSDWQNTAYTPAEIAAMNGIVRSVGTRTGPDANHAAFIDLDGASAVQFAKDRGCSLSQCGWGIKRTTSTERLKATFHIPEGLRHFLQLPDGSPVGKVVLVTKPPVYDLDANGKPKRDRNGQLIKLEPSEQIEIFYGTGQCIVLGEHVKSGGFYTWHGSPADITEPTPEWWQLITDVLDAETRRRSSTPRPSRSTSKSDVLQSGPRNPCPICGRNTSGACTQYTEGDKRRINCFEGQSFQPPVGLKPGDIYKGNDGISYGFAGSGNNPSIGYFAKFVEHTDLPDRRRPSGGSPGDVFTAIPSKPSSLATAHLQHAHDTQDEPDEESPAEAIARLISELLDLRLTTTDTWADEMAVISSLNRGYGVARPDIERRILEALAERWHLSITQTHSGRRTNRTSARSEDAEGQQMLVDGFLPWKRDTLIFGPGGVGKTTAAVALSWAVISGTPFLDHQITSDITGRVLWIGSDGGDGAYDMWVNTAQDFGIADDPRWIDGCVFWGSDPSADVGSWAATPAGLQELKNELESGSYALVVIDSWKAVLELAGIDFGIGPVGTVVRFLQALIGQHCSALYLHHPSGSARGKGIAGAGGNQNVNQIPYAVHQLSPEPASENQPRCVRWEVHKLRGYQSRDFAYRLTDEGLQVVDGEVIANCADAILVTIADLEALGTSTASYRVKNMLSTISEKTISNNLTRLRQRGLLRKNGSSWHLTHRGKLAHNRLLHDPKEGL